MRRALVLASGALLCAACSSGDNGAGTASVQSSSQAASAASVSSQAVSTSSASAAAPAAITGIGAKTADWASAHTPDTRFDAGTVWDPTPGLGSDDEHDARFYLVTSQAGVIAAFNMRFPSRSTLASASAEAKTTLPADATVKWQKKFDTCYAIQFQSRTLGKSTGSPSVGDPTGSVEFVFNSDEATGGQPSYNAHNVVGATALLALDKTPADFAGC